MSILIGGQQKEKAQILTPDSLQTPEQAITNVIKHLNLLGHNYEGLYGLMQEALQKINDFGLEFKNLRERVATLENKQ